MLVAIGTIAVVQSKGTEAMVKAVEHLLDYCASHPNATTRYTPSNMLLKGGRLFLPGECNWQPHERTITGCLNNPQQRDG
eukprot:1691391-Ditylum_brightwellii.AAC.1